MSPQIVIIYRAVVVSTQNETVTTQSNNIHGKNLQSSTKFSAYNMLIPSTTRTNREVKITNTHIIQRCQILS